MTRKNAFKLFLQVLFNVVFWAALFVGLASLGGCSATKKASICAKWEAENPEAFFRPSDTVYKTKVVQGDTARGVFGLSTIKTKGLNLTLKGASFRLRPIVGNNFAAELLTAPRIDTVIQVQPVYREKIKIVPESNFWRDFAIGAAACMTLIFVLKKILG